MATIDGTDREAGRETLDRMEALEASGAGKVIDLMEALKAALTPDPAAPVKVPSPLYGYRIATVGDLAAMANLPIGARATLLDTATHRVRYAVVRSWSGEGVNLDDDIHLSTVDDDLEQLGRDRPVTDGKRYWLLIEGVAR